MTGISIFFMLFGFCFLGGGFIWTLHNAMKHSKKAEK